MKITLIRHGKPVASSNPKVTASGFAKWVRAYNHSFVDMASTPPTDFYRQFETSFTLSSDLKRAIHSTEICLGNRADLVLSELRELDIPRLKLPFSMSVNSWLLLSRLCWFLGVPAKCESYKFGRARVISVVDVLVAKAQEHTDVAVFGHGLMNRLIAKELKQRGWTIESASKGFWGATELVHPRDQ